MRLRLKLGSFGILAFCISQSVYCQSGIYPDIYNVVWNTQSRNALESMPCGGGDIGMNVWVENGELLLYVDRSGNIDENDQQLKSGRFRILFQPNPFADTSFFCQELMLRNGSVIIKAKDFSVTIWVDVHHPVVHIESSGKQKFKTRALYESWRITARRVPVTMDEKGQLSGWDYNRWQMFGYFWYNGEVITYPDSITFQNNNSVLFYHNNNNNDLVFDKEIKLMRLEEAADSLVSPTKNRIFGGLMTGDDMISSGNGQGTYLNTPFKSWELISKKASVKNQIRIYFATIQSDEPDAWEKELAGLVASQKSNDQNAWLENERWWTEFWSRSRIIMNPSRNESDTAWQMARNYTLFRYQLACNAYGEWPTRFNGGLFTVDPVLIDNNNASSDFYNPDFRAWGAWTAQNQRLVYWPMIKNGDFDLIPSQLNFYSRNLPNAVIRVKESWGIEGAAYGEQIGSGGLPLGSHYGWEPPFGSRKPDQEAGLANLHPYYYTSQLEMGFIALELYRYANTDISAYIPFIRESVVFHFEYFKMLEMRRTGKPYDENGFLVLNPSHALETYRGKNSTDVICALLVNMRRLIECPDEWISPAEKEKFKEWLTHLPPVNFRMREGHKTIAPLGEENTTIGNYEVPQLYPVFPWGLYGMGKPDLEVAINTWKYGIDGIRGKEPWDLSKDLNDPIWFPARKYWYGWTQQAIWLARMGLTSEAREYIVKKLSDARIGNDFDSPTRMRFPSFWGPGFDWTPDHNWGGSGMIALQEMLMQTTDNAILLFPAWPQEWDVDFKLHAPKNTVVEVVYKNRKIEKLVVTPKSREKDVKVLLHEGEKLSY